MNTELQAQTDLLIKALTQQYEALQLLHFDVCFAAVVIVAALLIIAFRRSR